MTDVSLADSLAAIADTATAVVTRAVQSDWDPAAEVRINDIHVALLDGTPQVRSVTVSYDVVLPSGRTHPATWLWPGLEDAQLLVDQVAGQVVSDTLGHEGLANLWQPPA